MVSLKQLPISRVDWTFRKYPSAIHSMSKSKAKINGEFIEELLDTLELKYGHSRMIARFDPMDELISCILSQHTSDSSSFPAFTNLRATFPDWQDVVDAGAERVADVIRKAGLANQKSKSIINCLRAIKDELGEYSLEHLRGMPTLQARDWLLKLPSVGPKTASIVLCFSMGRETIPVDTHIFRVSRRIGVLPPDLDENKAHDYLLSLVPGRLAFRYHTVLIQHGRMTCKAPKPDCASCPVTNFCQWHLTGGKNLPAKQSTNGTKVGKAAKPSSRATK